MLSLLPLQPRLAIVASLRDRLPVRLLRSAEPTLWISGIVLGSLLTFWRTGLAWLAVTAGVFGMVLAAWRSVKLQAGLADALGRAVQERAALEQALRKSQQMEALGRLAGGVAHDFNNHLTVISSNVELVARRLDATQERLLRHVDAALQGVQRAAALTGRLLSFSRQPEPEPEPVDVDRVLGRLSDLLRHTLGERIGLDVRLSGASWFIWADVNQLESALLSLAVNVRDRVRDGGVLAVAVSNVHLKDLPNRAGASVLPGDYVRIAIGDAAAADEPARWQPADDLDSAELCMARTQLHDAGGYLLRSDPAADRLSLRIFLPRHRPSVPAAAACRPVSGQATILVVEDDPAMRALCVETLRDADHEVLEAADAMEAFRLIADRGGIDLLFTDLGLPGGVSGRALADAARGVDCGMRVLFTTGYERAGASDHACVAMLRKPFSPAQLTAKVRELLAAEHSVDRPETVQG